MVFPASSYDWMNVGVAFGASIGFLFGCLTIIALSEFNKMIDERDARRKKEREELIVLRARVRK